MSVSIEKLRTARIGHVRRTWDGLREDLRIFARGIGIVAAPSPMLFSLFVGSVILINLVIVAQVWLLKILVDRLAAGQDVGGAAVLFVLTLIVPPALGPPQQAINAWIENRAVAGVDRLLIQAGIRLTDLTRVERPTFLDEVRLAQENTHWTARLSALLQQGVGSAITLGGVLALLVHLHPFLPVVLIALGAPRMIAERRLNYRKYQTMARQSRAAREMDYCVRLATEPTAAKEVRVFGLGDFLLERFGQRADAALGEVSRLRLRGLALVGISGGLHALALAGGFWYVAARAGAGSLTLGDVALYLNAIIQAEARLMGLGYLFSNAHEILLRLRSLFALVDAAGPGIALPAPAEAVPVPASFRSGVELRAVRFAYPESRRPVLDGVSALLPAGKVTALVGANGAGKSTLVKLLTRMYDPDDGLILLDGVPLAAYDLMAWRRRVAVVYQDFARLALTLRENVLVGAVDLDTDTPAARFEVATRWSGADAVAAKLPNGSDTQLTRRFEGGVELSGGEWQKVALARAFIRDAALVILDEPTAALDAEAEHALFEQFRALVEDKTALLISHRFSTVRMADQIVVLEDGQVVEAGSHDALIAAGGRYAALYEMQAGRYRQES